MKDCFLLSSAFDADTPWIRHFHSDLERALRVREGASMTGVLNARPRPGAPDVPVRGIDAAARLPVMVALCRDDFFEDDWCGREWAVFTERLRLRPTNPAQATRGADTPHLLPLVWRRGQSAHWSAVHGLPGNPAERVAARLGRSYAAHDLHTLIRTQQWGKGGYFEVVELIADLVAAARRTPPPVLSTAAAEALPPAFGAPAEGLRPAASASLRTTSPWFPPPNPSAVSSPTASSPAGNPADQGPFDTGAGHRVGPAHVAVSYVGPNQPWADWIRDLLRARGHQVDLIRWNPLRGDRLSETLHAVEQCGADRLICLLSREYCVARADLSAAVTELEQWELLAGEGALRGRILRVVLDPEPLPEPLRSMSTIDLRGASAAALEQLLAQVQGQGRAGHPAPQATPLPARGPHSPPRSNAPVENDFFTGRDDDLDRIAALLDRDGHAAVVAKDALPDLGESEVAIEYSNRFRMRYDVIWWISCQGDLSIDEQLDRLPAEESPESQESQESLEPAGGPPEEGAARPAGDTPRRLLVFIAADDPDSIKEYFPQDGSHVLVVARNAGSWAQNTVAIGPLSRAESVFLLTETAPVNRGEADHLARLLRDRPGLIAEVAGHLVRREISLQRCIALLTDSQRYNDLPRDLHIRLMSMMVDDPGADPRAAQPSHSAPPVESPQTPQPPAGGRRRPPTEPHPASAPPIDLTEGTQPTADEAGQPSVPQRDVFSIHAALMGVWIINDPDAFDAWMALLSERIERRILLPRHEPLAVRVMALIRHALAQAEPELLDAMARALEERAAGDPSVRQFRRHVDNVRHRWGQHSGSGSLDSTFLVDPGSTAATHLADGVVPYFFLSYARRRDSDLVERFHRRLETEIGRRARRQVNTKGFLDRVSMEGGAHWRAELQEAVRRSPMMIALCSDDYFSSSWCGREWAVFQERIRRATAPGGMPPAAIIPVRWLPLTCEPPEPVQAVQMLDVSGATRSDLPVMDLIQEDESVVLRLMRLLTERMMKIAAAALPPLERDLTELVEPLFGSTRG
ncbi:hypothetical protein FrEUN1fDRAFT_6782 [Parafrankia sp. EUN1f]|nr:hypothetical protein FrEUN1fDRAFT_6782 [Parafrankia sp. EUN1f]